MAKKQVLPVGQERAADTIRKLRVFYAAGKKANQATLGYGNKVSAKYAQDSGYSKSRLDHARKFAKLISEAELEEICSLRDKQGHAIGIGHITLLLPISKRAQRHKLLQQWKKNAWPIREMKQAIRQIRPKTSHGGRKPAVSPNPQDALAELSQVTQRWLGRSSQFLQNGDHRMSSGPRLPDPVMDQIRGVVDAMRGLEASLQTLRASKRPKKRK